METKSEYEVKTQMNSSGETFKPSQKKEEKSKASKVVESYKEEVKTIWEWQSRK